MREEDKDVHRYDDMIDMPHHRSASRSHMSLHDRAAQFAPFAALTGYEDVLEETKRSTEPRPVLDETQITAINETLRYLSANREKNIRVAVTYFRSDPVKQGGAYLTDIGTIAKMDEAEKQLMMESGRKISMFDLINLEEL